MQFKFLQSYFNDEYYGVGVDDKPRFEYDAAVDDEPGLLKQEFGRLNHVLLIVTCVQFLLLSVL